MEESYVRCLMVESGEEKVVLQLLRAAGIPSGCFRVMFLYSPGRRFPSGGISGWRGC